MRLGTASGPQASQGAAFTFHKRVIIRMKNTFWVVRFAGQPATFYRRQ
jgi:hypothetical protein